MRLYLCLFLFFAFITSCSDAPSSTQEMDPETGNASAEKLPKGGPYEQLKKMGAEVKENKSSALKLVETNENTNVWGIFLRMSKWAKETHNSGYIVLAPSNDVIKKLGLLMMAELKYPENKDLLDRVMANHIIKSYINIEKAQEETRVETIDGKKLTWNPVNATIGGVHYNSPQLYAEKGSVLVMDGIIDLPLKEIEALYEKRKNAKGQ